MLEAVDGDKLKPDVVEFTVTVGGDDTPDPIEGAMLDPLGTGMLGLGVVEFVCDPAGMDDRLGFIDPIEDAIPGLLGELMLEPAVVEFAGGPLGIESTLDA